MFTTVSILDGVDDDEDANDTTTADDDTDAGSNDMDTDSIQ